MPNPPQIEPSMRTRSEKMLDNEDRLFTACEQRRPVVKHLSFRRASRPRDVTSDVTSEVPKSMTRTRPLPPRIPPRIPPANPRYAGVGDRRISGPNGKPSGIRVFTRFSDNFSHDGNTVTRQTRCFGREGPGGAHKAASLGASYARWTFRKRGL